MTCFRKIMNRKIQENYMLTLKYFLSILKVIKIFNIMRNHRVQ